MADPANVVAIDDIRALTGKDIRTVVATKTDVQAAINRHYRLDHAAETLVEEAAAEIQAEQDLDAQLASAGAEDAPIIKLVNLLITQAVNDRASDIHIEPGEHQLRVRYRIDGVLHEVMNPPKSVQAGITSRLKIMAEINIAERRIPQDGRIGIVVQGKQIDIRVATLPTVYGEKIVMRLLDKSSVLLQLADLGFLPTELPAVPAVVPQAVRSDPGHRTDGIGQVDDPVRDLEHPEPARGEHHHRRGPGRVPAAWREPGADEPQGGADVRVRRCGRSSEATRTSCLIGEIRDRETAQISIEAALTGHLVLSTLAHERRAFGA